MEGHRELVSARDRRPAINPALQRMFAERMGATTREVNTSHVPFVSNPAAVAGIIEEAAEATQQRAAAVQT